MSTEPHLRVATLADLDAFAAHVLRHVRESGVDGAPHFTPVRQLDGAEVRAAAQARWTRSLDEPLWGRCFVLVAAAQVVGHAELRGGRVTAERHRAALAMGVERAHTGHGHGRRLLDTCLEWAHRFGGLDHVDLGVFAANAPARRLYRAAGFIEQGVRRDAFRIDDGTRIDDVWMTLDLKGWVSARGAE